MMITSSQTTPRYFISLFVPSRQKTKAHLRIIDIVDFVKDDEFNISNQISSFIEHTSQNLGRHLPISFDKKKRKDAHNQTTTLGVDLHISSQNTDRRRIESSFEVSEFLIGKSFNR